MASKSSAPRSFGAAGNSRFERAGDTHLSAGHSMYSATDQDIRSTLYIKSDTALASYHGCSVDRVARLRSTQPKGRITGYKALASDSKGYGAQTDWSQSAQLSDLAMLRALVRYGLKHNGLPGLTAEQFYELADRVAWPA